MSNRKRARISPQRTISPHRRLVDLSPYEGVTVLGESLAVLLSTMLRLQLGDRRGGTVEVSATCPTHEVEAFERALLRTERPIPGDTRTQAQREGDRLLAVADRVFETVAAIEAVRSKGAA